MMPGTLSTVTRVTARSMSPKMYQATALAKAVKPARKQNARKSLTLIPNQERRCTLPAVAVCFRGDWLVLVSIEDTWAASAVISSTRPLARERRRQPEVLPADVGAVQPLDCLKAPVRLNYGKIDIIRFLGCQPGP